MTDLREETLRAKIQLVRTIRIAAVASLFLVYLFFYFILMIRLPLIYPLIGGFAVIFYNSFFAVLERKMKSTSLPLLQAFAAIRAMLDLSIIGIFLYLGGGILSPFTFIFFLPILGYAIIAGNLIFSLFMCFFGVIVYTLVLALPIYGILPRPPELVSPLGIRFILADLSILALLLFIFSFSVCYLINLLGKREYAALDAKINYNNVREELLQRAKELEEKNKSVVNRELEMIKLKQRINDLLAELGRPRKY